MASTSRDRSADASARVVAEFAALLDKSKQLFNGIRDLPQHGTKQWQGYFGRTFDVFTRLWKFQQTHRPILDSAYGLKRWQIGEMASKIGQLYYHYYLRTSETSYLLEAFSFYSAIRSRAYYVNTAGESGRYQLADLMVKKLRYYARFIVVCLLLKKLKLVRDLLRELGRQVEEYVGAFDPEDQLEWSLILSEIKAFVEADQLVNIRDVDGSTVILSHRLTAFSTPPLPPPSTANRPALGLSLQEVLIVGNAANQVKCTEISLDMFWMLQALEREPQEEALLASASARPSTSAAPHGHVCQALPQPTDSSPAPGRTPYDESFQRTNGKENPHKYLLYKPSLSQLLLFLSVGYRELPSTGVMLVYLSGDAVFPGGGGTLLEDPAGHKRNPLGGPGEDGYQLGGVTTNARSEPTLPACLPSTSAAAPHRDPHCLYPGDLRSYLRKPVFLIVESSNASAFLGLPRLFSVPHLALAAPQQIPAFLREAPPRGGLLTLFLHSPLTALCLVCGVDSLSIALWDKCQAHVDKFLADAAKYLMRAPSLDRAYAEFFGDDFLRLLILRYIFCHTTLRLHRCFKSSSHFLPHAWPALPEAEVGGHPNLRKLVLDLACVLDSLHLFTASDGAQDETGL